jgi:hypothetical protein
MSGSSSRRTGSRRRREGDRRATDLDRVRDRGHGGHARGDHPRPSRRSPTRSTAGCIARLGHRRLRRPGDHRQSSLGPQQRHAAVVAPTKAYRLPGPRGHLPPHRPATPSVAHRRPSDDGPSQCQRERPDRTREHAGYRGRRADETMRSVSDDMKIGGAGGPRSAPRATSSTPSFENEHGVVGFDISGEADLRRNLLHRSPRCSASPSPASSGVAVKTRVFSMLDTTILSPSRRFTIEKGSSVRAQKLAYGLLTDFGLSITRQSGLTLTGARASASSSPTPSR